MRDHSFQFHGGDDFPRRRVGTVRYFIASCGQGNNHSSSRYARPQLTGYMNVLYWLRSTSRKHRKQIAPYRLVSTQEMPETPQVSEFYLLGQKKHPWAAAFLCPCGCEAMIQLNLLSEATPCWKVRKHLDSSVSVSPSVNRITGCRSHFWIRKGIVKWASF